MEPISSGQPTSSSVKAVAERRFLSRSSICFTFGLLDGSACGRLLAPFALLLINLRSVCPLLVLLRLSEPCVRLSAGVHLRIFQRATSTFRDRLGTERNAGMAYRESRRPLLLPIEEKRAGNGPRKTSVPCNFSIRLPYYFPVAFNRLLLLAWRNTRFSCLMIIPPARSTTACGQAGGHAAHPTRAGLRPANKTRPGGRGIG